MALAEWRWEDALAAAGALEGRTPLPIDPPGGGWALRHRRSDLVQVPLDTSRLHSCFLGCSQTSAKPRHTQSVCVCVCVWGWGLGGGGGGGSLYRHSKTLLSFDATLCELYLEKARGQHRARASGVKIDNALKCSLCNSAWYQDRHNCILQLRVFIRCFLVMIC